MVALHVSSEHRYAGHRCMRANEKISQHIAFLPTTTTVLYKRFARQKLGGRQNFDHGQHHLGQHAIQGFEA